ncbi:MULTISPECIES: hypothetical protein [Streptosporangium]|uniref:SRPBCC family protein n=1 Tax=Streptosporangium brasiliense TaxID=47480 RepID=A0ABT9RKJ5_9ACTN|nr:hypothetical protein [Streptosporangium brasiliense]MDP9868840.1 hypothetical protein [Streptosporangium brasiliense]
MSWPFAELDAVRRLRVLAAAIPGAHVAERFIPAPFAEVWAVAGNLEREFGTFEPDMRALTLEPGGLGGRLVARARSRYGMRARFDVDLSPGWCWMQSRFLLIGLAATAVPGGTLVAQTGGVRVPGRAALVPWGVRAAGEKALGRLAARFGEQVS